MKLLPCPFDLGEDSFSHDLEIWDDRVTWVGMFNGFRLLKRVS